MIRRIAASLLPLVVFTALMCVDQWLPLRYGVAPQTPAALASMGWRLILVAWVYLDRQGRVFQWPFEFDAFIFFCWPFVLPYYLYKTRGILGLFYALGIFILAIVPNIVSTIAVLSIR